MSDSHMFTCISCAVAFNDPAMQRSHFASDWHRYNMKRRVASLPPVSANMFNEKVMEKREQNAIRVDPRGMHCDCCRKQFSTENAYRSHISSKKHRLVEQKYLADRKSGEGEVASYSQGGADDGSSDEEEGEEGMEEEDASDIQVEKIMLETTKKPEEAVKEGEEKVEEKIESKLVEEDKPASAEASGSSSTPTRPSKLRDVLASAETEGNDADAEMDSGDEDEEEEEQRLSPDESLTLEQRILAARAFHPTHCLFCHKKSPTIERSFEHMFKVHSFYVPEQQFLVDPTGFLLYLAEKLAVGNVCLFCEAEFGTLGAVRGHMQDKRHQKIRYEDENDKAEFAEWYDFSGSYPDAEERRLKDVARAERREERRQRREEQEERRAKRQEELEGDGGWEEEEGEGEEEQGDMDVDEVVVVDEAGDASSDVSDDTDESDFSEDDHGISLASDGLSLRLPSGRTLGHRSLKVYYQQNLRPESQPLPDSTSTALTTKLRSVRAKLADPSLSLVPVGGGAGAFGKGQMVMKARNAGEAKWAKKLGRSHLDQRKKEAPRQLVSMRGGNNQKHYRDMLLQ